MQSEYFKLTGIKPGEVILADGSKIDFRQKISNEKLFKLYASGFPYLKLTEAGEAFYFPKPKPIVLESVIVDNKEVKKRFNKRTKINKKHDTEQSNSGASLH